jgi:uncharacterized membrane protein
MNVRNFFTPEQQALLKAAIGKAEHETNGEIRLHLENNCDGDPVQRATAVFHRLHMHKTKNRNSVLFYLAVNHKKLAVVGDEAIHKLVSDDFWKNVTGHIIARFKEGNYTEGLCEGIAMTGEKLKSHFPHSIEKKNELPDDISFGKN